MPRPRTLRPIAAALVPLCIALAGCDPLTLTMLGVGAGAGVSHQMGGLAYRTFTAPMARVRAAALLALERMGIRVDSVAASANGETVYAQAAGRRIEVEIEALTPAITRMRAVARKDALLLDSATALEIISQTEKALEV